MNRNKLYDTIDIRDGLSIRLRNNLSVFLQESNSEGRFKRTSKYIDSIVEKNDDDYDKVAIDLIDMGRSSCRMNLVDGHGDFSYYPAHPDFMEARPSNFLKLLFKANQISNPINPLEMPLPYLLIEGSVGYSASKTKIPKHNIDAVVEATIALINNPDLTTKDLVEIIKCPELYVGGIIMNEDELPTIYERGSGVFHYFISNKTKSDSILEKPYREYVHFCEWNEHKLSKPIGARRGEYEIEVQYNALLTDGRDERLYSLKEMLQGFIDFYKTFVGKIADEYGLREERLDNKLLSRILACDKQFLSQRE